MISISRWDCWNRRLIYLILGFVPLAYYLRMRFESHVFVPLLQDVLTLLAAIMAMTKLAFVKRAYRWSATDVLVFLFIAYNILLIAYCLIGGKFLTAAYLFRFYVAGAMIYFACRSSVLEQNFSALLQLFFALGVVFSVYYIYEFFTCNVLGHGLPDWVIRANDYIVSTGRGGEIWWVAKDSSSGTWYYLPGLLGSKHATPAFSGACAVALFAYWSSAGSFKPFHLIGFLLCSAAVLMSMNVTSILSFAGVFFLLLLAQMRRSFLRFSVRLAAVLGLLMAVGVYIFYLNPSGYYYAFFAHFDSERQGVELEHEEPTILGTSVIKDTTHRGALFKILQTPVYYLDRFFKNPMEGLLGTLPILPLFGSGHGLFFFSQWGVVGICLMLGVLGQAMKTILSSGNWRGHLPSFLSSMAAASFFWIATSLHNEGFIDSFACYYWWFACLAGMQITTYSPGFISLGNKRAAVPIDGSVLGQVRGSHV